MWISKKLWEFLERELADAKTALKEERARCDRLAVEIRGLRSRYETEVTTLRVGHAAAVARAHESEVQQEKAHSTTDWLAAHVNSVETNRAMLEAHLLNTNPVRMQIDTAQLGRRDRPSTTRVDGGEIAGTIDDTPLSPEDVPDLLKGQQSIFDDMGDNAARRAGMDWGAAGEVVTR